MANKQQLEQFRSQIREAGLRVTAPRLSVLQVLAGAPTPLSHAEIAERLEPVMLDRATVYRNLQDLAEVGMLRRTDHGDHVWRFELVGKGSAHSGDPHPHFVCSQCGTVSCLPGASFTLKASKTTPQTVRKGAFEVQLRGICDECH